MDLYLHMYLRVHNICATVVLDLGEIRTQTLARISLAKSELSICWHQHLLVHFHFCLYPGHHDCCRYIGISVCTSVLLRDISGLAHMPSAFSYTPFSNQV